MGRMYAYMAIDASWERCNKHRQSLLGKIASMLPTILTFSSTRPFKRHFYDICSTLRDGGSGARNTQRVATRSSPLAPLYNITTRHTFSFSLYLACFARFCCFRTRRVFSSFAACCEPGTSTPPQSRTPQFTREQRSIAAGCSRLVLSLGVAAATLGTGTKPPLCPEALGIPATSPNTSS